MLGHTMFYDKKRNGIQPVVRPHIGILDIIP